MHISEHLCPIAIVVPVRGKGGVIERSLASLSLAVARCPGAVLVLVDNNREGEDSSVLNPFRQTALIVPSSARTVGGVRNDGVRWLSVTAKFLAFVDCDCVVPQSFCSDVIRTFADTSAMIVGSRVVCPPDGHWTEIAHDNLHREVGDGPRKHLNSGCMAVRASAFATVGGFSDTLPANEDYDLCSRVRAIGGSIWQAEILTAVHLGNPKSIGSFCRRLMWHGRGAMREDGSLDLSAMLVATLSHAVVVSTGTVLCIVFLCRGMFLYGLMTLSVACMTVPIAFWLSRVIQYRRWISFIPSVALMFLTFASRLSGLLLQFFSVQALRRSGGTIPS